MLQKIFTHQEHSPALGRPRVWQGYLRKLFAVVMLLGGLGVSQRAWGQYYNYDDIYITAKPTGTSNSTSTIYSGAYSANSQSSADFQGADLGNNSLYDQATGALTLTALIADINSAGKPIQDSRFAYKVYLQGTAVGNQPAFTYVTLDQTSSSNNGSNVTFSKPGLTIDLLNQPAVLGGGTYVVEIQFSSTAITVGRNGATPTQVTDPNGSTGYQATFRVIAPAVTPPGGTTTWQSTNSTDWRIPANWSNGVPRATANAIIPEQTNPTTFAYPVLDDPNYNYTVRNLTLQGAENPTRAKMVVGAATLTVYGNLSQISGGLSGGNTFKYGSTSPGQNPTLIFAGDNQIISGNLEFSDIIIAGTGTKSVVNTMTVLNILAFTPASVSDGVILQSAIQDASSSTVKTVFSTAGTSYVRLGSSGIISTANGQAETNTSFIRGVARADRNLSANTFDSYGNLGLDITPNHDAGVVSVFRVVGVALQSPSAYPSAKPVKRQYQIIGDANSNSAGFASSTVNVRFHYLPSADELNSIEEENLTMFRTIDGKSYQFTNGNLNTGQRIFTRNNLPTLDDYTLTLGDRTNPLPVTLVAFGAVRSGGNTQLVWTTASEKDNSGFNVQVSQDGVNFRTLAFVASQSPNSSTTLTYKYTDSEAGKTGTRYYRLEQVDEGGKTSFSPVRAINFSGVAATGASVLVAYPNPFTDGISLSLDGGSVADGTAYIKLIDITGRTVRESKLPLVGASLTLSDLSSLRSGLYVAKVTLPDGTTQTVRVSKQ